MVATSDPLQRGMTAPDFALPGTDGRTWRYADVAGPQRLVVMFICNHCPYVQAVVDRIVRGPDARLKSLVTRALDARRAHCDAEQSMVDALN
jgi:peroxiredoxin